MKISIFTEGKSLASFAEDIISDNKSRPLNSVLRQNSKERIAIFEKATPVRTGKTASSWTEEYRVSGDSAEIIYSNSNKTRDGHSVVKLLVKGHGNGKGGYTRARDFLKPSAEAVGKKLIEDIIKVRTNRKG